MAERAPLPDQSESRYREGWLLRGRKLNAANDEIYRWKQQSWNDAQTIMRLGAALDDIGERHAARMVLTRRRSRSIWSRLTLDETRPSMEANNG